MPALSDVVAFQSSVGDVTTLAMADVLGMWRSLPGGDPGAVAGEVRGLLPDVVDAYTPLAAEVAATFYDETRAAANAPGSYLARLAESPSLDRIQQLIGWALSPLFRPDAPDSDLALSRLTGGTQKFVADASRETIEVNIDADKDLGHPRFARHASANACAFCALMASRGAVYRSAAAGGAGNKYHEHCHCVAYVVFPGEDDNAAPYVAEWDRAYIAARKSAKSSGIKSPKLGDILPHMRESLGVK